MREAVDKVRIQANQAHQLFNAIIEFFTCSHTKRDKRFGNDIANSHTRVEAGIRVLEDHLDFFAHQTHWFFFETHQVNIPKVDMTGSGLVELHDCPACRGFPTARFPYQTQGFAFLDVKRDTIHSFY
jgi:hypothetical protein